MIETPFLDQYLQLSTMVDSRMLSEALHKYNLKLFESQLILLVLKIGATLN